MLGCDYLVLAWLSKSKEPLCYWLVALIACETKFFIGLAGQSVKPNCVLACLWVYGLTVCKPVVP